MKESHIEGLANHDGPKSDGSSCKVTGGAMTGVRTGGVLSRENIEFKGADAVIARGRQHRHARNGEGMSDPARSKTSSMCRNSMRENRESLHPSSEDGTEERAEKDKIHNPVMNGCRQSDSPILPAKLPNKCPGNRTAEAVEGRGLTKGKAVQQNTPRTQSRTNDVPNELHRIRQAAIRKRVKSSRRSCTTSARKGFALHFKESKRMQQQG